MRYTRGMSLRRHRPARCALRPGVALAGATLVALLAPACASEQVRWGDETETLREVTTTTTEAKPLSAKEYAARFPTDSDCEGEVRRLALRSVERARQLLAVCVERGDFKRIGVLLDGPLSASLAKDAAAPGLCARIVAARAGDVDTDVTACNRAGIPVVTLEALFNEPDKAAGRLLITRLRVDPDHRSKVETRLIEMALVDVDTNPTGRRIAARPGPHAFPDGDVIVLARGVKVADDKLVDDGESVAVVDVLAVHPAAVRPTF